MCLCSYPIQDFPNYAVPKIDARLLLELIPKPTPADLGATTVSVDVLSIVGSVSSAINSDTNVFYDTEILAIIQRVKVKSSGLVDTKVWGWIGKDAKVNPKEEKALTDLAKRYGTKLVSVVLILFSPAWVKLNCRTPSSNTTSQLIWSRLLVAHWQSVRYVCKFRSALIRHTKAACV